MTYKEYNATQRQDGEKTRSHHEALIERDRPAALRYLARRDALDLVECLGLDGAA